MNINQNVKLGLIAAVVLILLFVLSMLLTGDPSMRTGVLTLLPPLVAIGLAFITKDTILSLFAGVFIGEFMLVVTDMNLLASLVNAFFGLVNEVIGVATDPWNMAIILQCFFIGGVIALVAKMGGAKALAEALSKKANSPKKAQLITWVLGLLVFFDDYANSLIVGPIMTPVMDKLKVSREKLAFIVDSTAAPVAGIAIISTWIGLELSLINDGLDVIGLKGVTAFSLFLQSIPFRFYNILILAFIVISALTLREFGPMKKAEQEARKRKTGEKPPEANLNLQLGNMEPAEKAKLTIWNAIIPIGTLIIVALIAFYWTGYTAIVGGEDEVLRNLMLTSPISFNGIFEAMAAADASIALLQSAIIASVVAILMAVGQRIYTVGEAITNWIQGLKTIVITFVILLLAWSLGAVIGSVGTADYLISILSGTIPYWILPALIFLFGAVISFATGTAYGTMGILMPLAIPLAWAVKTGDVNYLVVCISGVLTGAIFGDHCSPISDTTIMSSMGSGCDHIAHVNTQIYYAVFVGITAIVIGYLPAGFGVPSWVSLIAGVIVVFLGLRFIGEEVPFEEEAV